jgi:hypothetical protein
MRRLFAALVCAAMAASLAACSGTTAYGGIQKIDATAHTVTLFTGDTFQFDASADLTKWKVGDDVQIPYTTDQTTKKKVAGGISTYP